MKKQWMGFFAGILTALMCVAMIGSVYAMTGQQMTAIDYNNINVTLDGKEVVLVDANGNAVEPFVISGTTYLPVRAIASAFGLNVVWDQDTTTVILTRPEAKRPVYMTKTGKRYHYESTCNGGTYWEVPLATAINMGLTPCDKCVLTKGQ